MTRTPVCIVEMQSGSATPERVGYDSHTSFWNLLETSVEWATGKAPGVQACHPTIATIYVDEQLLTMIQTGGEVVVVSATIDPVDPRVQKAFSNEEAPIRPDSPAEAYRKAGSRTAIAVGCWLKRQSGQRYVRRARAEIV